MRGAKLLCEVKGESGIFYRKEEFLLELDSCCWISMLYRLVAQNKVESSPVFAWMSCQIGSNLRYVNLKWGSWYDGILIAEAGG